MTTSSTVSFNLSKPGCTAPDAVPTVPMVAVSRDSGRTFADLTDLSAGQFDAAPSGTRP